MTNVPKPDIEPIDIEQLRNSLKLLKDKEVYNSLKKLWPPWKLELAELIAQILEEAEKSE